jgi:hypothetical protein
MDLRDVGWGSIDWFDLVQDRDRWRALVNTVMNFRVPSNAGNFLSSWGRFSFSGRSLEHHTKEGSLGESLKVLLPPLHTKPGVIKNFVWKPCEVPSTWAVSFQISVKPKLNGGRFRPTSQKSYVWKEFGEEIEFHWIGSVEIFQHIGSWLSGQQWRGELLRNHIKSATEPAEVKVSDVIQNPVLTLAPCLFLAALRDKQGEQFHHDTADMKPRR